MKKVSQKELAQILLNTKVVANINIFASVLQATNPPMTVKSRTDKTIKNNFGEVVKLSKVGILLNSNYIKAVENQLIKEDKDTSEYKQGKNTMVIEFGENNQFIGTYNNEFVLQYRPNDNVKPKSKFIANGKITDKKKLVDFLPVDKPATNQGTEREITWRKLYLKNVRKLTLNGETYKVID